VRRGAIFGFNVFVVLQICEEKFLNSFGVAFQHFDLLQSYVTSTARVIDPESFERDSNSACGTLRLMPVIHESTSVNSKPSLDAMTWSVQESYVLKPSPQLIVWAS
jgi:hypothetical protein